MKKGLDWDFVGFEWVLMGTIGLDRLGSVMERFG